LIAQPVFDLVAERIEADCVPAMLLAITTKRIRLKTHFEQAFAGYDVLNH
jgi:hypothetical protein